MGRVDDAEGRRKNRRVFRLTGAGGINVSGAVRSPDPIISRRSDSNGRHFTKDSLSGLSFDIIGVFRRSPIELGDVRSDVRQLDVRGPVLRAHGTSIPMGRGSTRGKSYILGPIVGICVVM